MIKIDPPHGAWVTEANSELTYCIKPCILMPPNQVTLAFDCVNRGWTSSADGRLVVEVVNEQGSFP